MTRVMLTGARGFVGRPAIAVLRAQGFAIDAVSSQPVQGDDDGTRWHQADLTDPHAVRELVARLRPTHLLHLAWHGEHRSVWTSAENERWLDASLVLLDAFDGERVVCAGTCAEYDWTRNGTLDEASSPILPQTPYGIAKDALRAAAQERLDARGVSFAWARMFFLHGPHEHPDRLVASVTRALLAGVPARCTDGQQVRDFLHSSDAAGALAALLASDVQGPVNVASGEAVSVAQLVGWIGDELGRSELIELGALARRPGDPERLVADVARLREEVGFTPAYRPREAISQTVRWWARQGGPSQDRG
jgi:nucleoside-diphosphate-sugar epimerase